MKDYYICLSLHTLLLINLTFLSSTFFCVFKISGNAWNETGVKGCSNETTPVTGSTYSTGLPQESLVLEAVLRNITKPVQYLNITALSQLRKDGHPSKYNGVKRPMDCTHWCVAGVPDIWNQLVYATLISPYSY